ncbi:MAG: Rpn family recombination-promoting nuclease/putative transposase [Tannerella sp.]|jgi:predicted transposase/invertase (TIGR01784 family)|nr:Rpn family recombination-promoting nuclease/putative transposase [Tannerella sp.]
MGKTNYIRFDWAIKRLLRQKANFVILEGFLSTVLGDDIRIEKILDSESNKEHAVDKFNRVDLLAENSAGELLIIEVQNNRELNYFHRMLYGTSKVITEYIGEGEEYDNVKKVYSINVVYFELGQGKDYVYHGRTEFRGIHGKDILQLSASQKKQFACKEAGDIYPEYYILRVEDFNEVATTQLDEWILFLKTSEIPENATAKGLSEARKRLRVDNMSASERATYNDHIEAVRYQQSVIKTGIIEGREEGREEGIKEGIKEGRVEAFTEVVVNAYRNGLTIEQIQTITQLGEEQIREILNIS